jgi:hypothetical protein
LESKFAAKSEATDPVRKLSTPIRIIIVLATGLQLTAGNAARSCPAESVHSEAATASAISVLPNGNIVVAAQHTLPSNVANQMPVIADATNGQVRLVVSDPAMLASQAQVLNGDGELMAEIVLRHVNHVDVKNWPAGKYTLRLVDGRTVGITCH